MSGVPEGRARPLSGGLWTLFSWLRRDDHSSTESVSSAGSDRTALSFAFLPPGRCSGGEPARLPPPPPPSDSYRRRVRERNLRRQWDRDLTLHRKYGLYGLGFDINSLPAPNRRLDESDRVRRATSESPRAHVPGKRRAPPPPLTTATLPRRRARKRPAPLPPLNIQTPQIADTTPMNPLPLADVRPRGRDDVTGCKQEKYSKKDTHIKETNVKLRSEKSFLKNIFENKKRNSAIDTASVKLLPSISELDKQAAEMIEKYRLKEVPQSEDPDRDMGQTELAGCSKRHNEAWICTRCLKKYDSSVITCNYCLPLNKLSDSYKNYKVSNNCTQTKSSLNNAASSSSSGNIEEKEKLKEMLKEMKDSLPKRPKSELVSSSKSKNTRDKDDYPKSVEAATLRIGSTTCVDKKQSAQTSTSKVFSEQSTIQATTQHNSTINDNDLTTINSVIITQPVVLVHTKENIFINDNKTNKISPDRLIPSKIDEIKVTSGVNNNITKEDKLKPTNQPKTSNHITKSKYDLNTPLKISSLLNPIYVPKTTATVNTQTQIFKQVEGKKFGKEMPTLSLVQQSNTEEIIRKLVVPHMQMKSSIAQVNKNEKLISETKNKEKLLLKSTKHIDEQQLTETEAKKHMSNTQIQPAMPEISKNKQLIPETNNKEEMTNMQLKSVTPQINANKKLVTETKTREDTKELGEKHLNKHTKGVKLNDVMPTNNEVKSSNVVVNTTLSSVKVPSTSKESSVNQHARRRELINQLERSIARGDEKAAADAAVKLAQLKLSCSVLSFSSQIVAEPSGSSQITTQPEAVADDLNIEKKSEIKKEEVLTQNSLSAVPLRPTREHVSKQTDKKQLVKEVNEKVPIIENGKLNEANPKLESASQPSCVIKETNTKSSASSEASTSNGVASRKEDDDVPILIWVEDKESTRGPVQLHVKRGAVLGELRRQAERSLGIASRLQRWIVGRTLCADERASLLALAGPDLSAPFYLCLVESDTKTATNTQTEVTAKEDPGNVYNELVKLEKQALVANAEAFECGVCMEECGTGSGVVLRECVHCFCKECLSDVVRHSEEAVVACPAMGCRGFLEEREIRGLVSSDDYEKWLARGLAAAESGSRNAFHCRTRDCTGWAMCDPGVRRFPCPVCKRNNCLPCQAIHEGETCEQHRAKLAEATSSPDASQTDEGTRALLDSLISRGEALECPQCSTIITKKWGCDWIKCSACKTEICWVTRQRRWGPAGRGDTSGGCRCGVDGKKCHPSCGYCH